MIYLDNAATTFPKPKSVISEMAYCMSNYCANPGRSGHFMASKMSSKIYEARELISDFFNIKDPLRVVFTSNATEALNLSIKGILQPGDHVITTAMEHNSVLRPLKELREVITTVIPASKEGKIHVEDISTAIRSSTKMIICTHSSNVTGTIMPIKKIGEICRKNKILFMVDCSQSAGILPIDVERDYIDILASSGHKSLLGPQGTGFLYVSPGITISPLKSGGTGTESSMLNQPQNFPEGYEAGTLNGPGIIGLAEGIRFINKIGISSIRQWECYISAILLEALMNMENLSVYGPYSTKEKTAVISFNINNIDCETVADILNRSYSIAVRSGYHCAPLAHKSIGTFGKGTVRLSPGLFTRKEEIIKTIDSIRKICG